MPCNCGRRCTPEPSPEQAVGFLRPRHARDFRNFALYFPVLLLVSACHKPSAPPPVNESPTSPASPALAESTHDDTALPDIGTLVETYDPARWLHVKKTREGAPGGWATGSFDPKRNKLAIHTRNVEQFTIDVSRVPIDWERLVVIGINGRNAELRKRDYAVLHFARNRHGQWVVIEP